MWLSPAVFFSDLFLFDILDAKWYKGLLSSSCTNFSGRAWHAAEADGHGRIYVFGGMTKDDRILGDMWALELSYSSYIQDTDEFLVNCYALKYDILNEDSILPSARYGSTLMYIEGYYYMYGGNTKEGGISGCEILRSTLLQPQQMASVSWTRQKLQSSKCPPKREMHSAARLGRNMIVAGGCDTSLVAPQCYNDIWKFDTEHSIWAEMVEVQANSFTPRMSHASVFIDDLSLLIYGGMRLEFESSSPTLIALVMPTKCSESCYKGGGLCIDNRCRCSGGFFQPDCGSLEYLGVDASAALCNGNGLISLSGRCDCFLGFKGSSCESGTNTCINNCSGHGVCSRSSRCICQPGFLDIDCSYKASCPDLCCNHGHCLKSGECSCDDNYFGRSCSVTIEDIYFARQIIHDSESRLNGLKHKLSILESKYPHQKKINSEKSSSSLPQQISISKEFLESTLKQMEEAAKSDEAMAKFFFKSENCKAEHILPSLQNLIQVMHGVNESRSGPLKTFSSTGRTATEQLQMHIRRCRTEGQDSGILPPGLGDILIEDVYEAIKPNASFQKSNIDDQTRIDSKSYVAELGLIPKSCISLILCAISCSSVLGMHIINKRAERRFKDDFKSVQEVDPSALLVAKRGI